MKATEIEDYTDDDILQDGESVRVPMMLLDADSVQRAVATSQVTDAFVLNKPGIRDARTLLGARVWGRTPESRRQHKRELEQETADRDAAFAERDQYLKDAWKTSQLGTVTAPTSLNDDSVAPDQRDASPADLRDAAYEERDNYLRNAWQVRDQRPLMQKGYHPMLALEYQERDVRGPQAEVGAPDSETARAYEERDNYLRNAWRLPSIVPTPFTPNYQRFDPQPGGGPDNERKIAEARARQKTALANLPKNKSVGVAREDYIRRTRTAWDPTAATGIEAQREKWLGK
jgi:hypothetical protein